MDIEEFNRLNDHAAGSLLTTCLAVPRWVDEVLNGRPYATAPALVAAAGELASSLTAAEVESALARHPRIGERAGDGHDAEFSEREQSGFDHDDADRTAAMAQGNVEYERRFGRVFLIRAAGRSAEEILTELRRRLANEPADEVGEVVRELGEIAVLRLEQLVSDPTHAADSYAGKDRDE